MSDTLVLRGPDGFVEIDEDWLLVFVDETGDERTSDPNHPIFGFGGIVTPQANYLHLRQSWLRTKEKFFDPAQPLHAADLRNPPHDVIEAINQIMVENFGRVAVTTSRDLENLTEFEMHHIVSSAFVSRVSRLAQTYAPHPRAALIFEASERADALVELHFARFKIGDLRHGKEVHTFFMPKSACEPGLEISDFVIQAAGGQSRRIMSYHRTGDSRFKHLRKDFEVLFGNERERKEFLFLWKAEANSK